MGNRVEFGEEHMFTNHHPGERTPKQRAQSLCAALGNAARTATPSTIAGILPDMLSIGDRLSTGIVQEVTMPSNGPALSEDYAPQTTPQSPSSAQANRELFVAFLSKELQAAGRVDKPLNSCAIAQDSLCDPKAMATQIIALIKPLPALAAGLKEAHHPNVGRGGRGLSTTGLADG